MSGKSILISPSFDHKRNVRNLLKYLENSPFTQDQRFEIISFILGVNRIKWGKGLSAGVNNRKSSAFRIIKVRNFRKALKLKTSDEFVDAISKTAIVRFGDMADSEENYFAVCGIIGDFCYQWYDSRFYYSTHTILTEALMERLYRLPPYYLEMLNVLKKGHYICGFRKPDTFYVV